jgi:hypothetical protein
MFKRFFTYPVFLVLYLSLIGSICFGALIKYHYDGGKKFQLLQKQAIFIASIPFNIKQMIKHKTLNLDKPPILFKHKDKKKLEQFIENKRNALLILPRYDHSLSRSVVDIVDLNNFEVIHTYQHDIDKMYAKINNLDEYPRLKIDSSPIRFLYQHPLLFEDGSLIGIMNIAYKLDFCSNLEWINDEETFHHSQMLDHEGNIWVGGRMKPKAKSLTNYVNEKYQDDSIIKLNDRGKIIYNKSITELLIENNLINKDILKTQNIVDYIHLNDIEPALTDTKYWNIGDLFISIRNQNAIIHYRPSTNKVINYITGPFDQQHDVDIISDSLISIFNNNNFSSNNEYSNIVLYDFETKKFNNLFDEQLREEKFKTESEGLSHIFKDGSLLVEEQNQGRIILINHLGKKEWEFVNKDKNGNIGYISWSRVIENESFIKKFKSNVKNKKCLN